jgi:hypothetical protein
MAESEVSMGCIVSAGTPGVVSLPMLSWNGDCFAARRWRGVSHRGGSSAVARTTKLGRATRAGLHSQDARFQDQPLIEDAGVL